MAGEEAERQRLWNERRRVWLDEWKINVEPVEKERASALQNSVAYGQLAMRNVFLLNGGGLVAVPTFAQLVKQPLSEALALFLAGIGFYVLGLALITVVALLAYLNFQYHKQFSDLIITARANTLNRAFGGEAPLHDEKNPDVIAQTKLVGPIDKTAFWGVALGIAAGACFLLGTTFSMMVLAGVKD